MVTADTIKNAYLQTENGFTSLVAELFNERPGIATVGSCCLVGVIYQQTLFVANLGDARVVLGKKVGNTGGMAAIQLSSEHNANLEEVRHELKSLHPHDPNIVALKHGVWRVKGIIQVILFLFSELNYPCIFYTNIYLHVFVYVFVLLVKNLIVWSIWFCNHTLKLFVFASAKEI